MICAARYVSFESASCRNAFRLVQLKEPISPRERTTSSEQGQVPIGTEACATHTHTHNSSDGLSPRKHRRSLGPCWRTASCVAPAWRGRCNSSPSPSSPGCPSAICASAACGSSLHATRSPFPLWLTSGGASPVDNSVE
jgi:hypothetical protein